MMGQAGGCGFRLMDNFMEGMELSLPLLSAGSQAIP
jgi:hypothetical protein